ncbi:MAG TPA: Na+/H+ antiporter [Bryobacteraceae bacterium]
MPTDLHNLELVLIVLLVFVVGFGALANRLKTPYPILLVIGGLVLSLIPGIPRFHLEPDFIFLGVLPPLLFAAGFTTSWRDFRYNLVSISLLAFGLVGFTVVGVALIAHWMLPGFDWRLGLVLGAVVSTTDAIAATSIAKRVGLPRRIIDVLEGESLINDATGLLALEFAVALVVTGQTSTFTENAGRLLYLVIGGVATGLALGKIINWLEHRIDHAPIEITISIVTPYAAYLMAEEIHSSGVLAAVACGLYLGRRSATFFSSVVRIEAQAFWNTLIFILNGIVFILIGLQLPYILAGIRDYSLRELVLRGGLVSAAVILLRLIWVFPGAYLSYFIRRNVLKQHEEYPAARGIFIVGWTGMRGVVALAAAISLPEMISNGMPFPQRNLILFLTFCVIFVTLVLQGLTLSALIPRLGVTAGTSDKYEEIEARRIMIEAALQRLEETPAREQPSARAILEDLGKHYRIRHAALERVEGAGRVFSEQHDLFESVARDLRSAERASAIRLRDQDRISDETLQKLLRELDLQDARVATAYPEDDAAS